MSRRKRILITGADGFIGGALGKFFSQRRLSFEVIGISRRREIGREIIRCNLNDPQKTLDTLAALKPYYIFHCAGGRSADEQKIWRSNFETTKILLESVLKIKNYRPRIVIPGSAAEYGPLPAGVKSATEKLSAWPSSWYAFVKYMQTSLGLMYARKGLDVRIARIFNIGGYGTPSSLALGNFAKKIVQIERGKELPALKVGRLTGRRDFIDIEDVCSALWAIAHRGKKGEVYNVCSGRPLSMRFLLAELISHSNIEATIQEGLKMSSTTFDITGSNIKIRRATGWRPSVSLEQSLKNTLQYYREL